MARFTYNPVVYLVDDALAERCQFVYQSGRQCRHDGKYRIGQNIFLCGYHMPGIGRRAHGTKPIAISGVLMTDGQNEVQLHKADGTTIRWRSPRR